ncbi:hypothetical protein ACFPJ4_14930 [Lysinimonas soli]|uniref:DUF4255 domain-containing protein n=1 Tax=Lysinimonas soli TaxID=1074233 RepID=A0ABW0NSN8_9MICO
MEAATTPAATGAMPGDPTRSASSLPPAVRGWVAAASAVLAARRMPVPLILRLRVADRGALTLNFARHCFTGDIPLDALPVDSVAILVETGVPAPADAVEYDLDPLLWLIGTRAFPDEPAPWLAPSERYHLVRFPNLRPLPIGLDVVRMTAILGNAYANADELAVAARVPLADARTVINGYSLVGILTASSGAAMPAAAAQPGPAAAAEPSRVETAPADAAAAPDAARTDPPKPGTLERLRGKLGL